MKFIKIKWKNFLSYGNNWTEINLDTKQIVTIHGKNGSGKSCIIDAFFYVLTGNTFRPKIKKAQIINNKNKKNCIVEINLLKGKNKFVIRRGIKPDIFEIEKNNEKLSEVSNVKDFQTILEQILNFNPKMLKNSVIMSSMDYKPFLKFNAQDKRYFIENLLNLNIFAYMLHF